MAAVTIAEEGRWLAVSVEGDVTEAVVRSVNEQVFQWVQSSGKRLVLLDLRRMASPPTELAWLQRQLTPQLESTVRCAVLVSSARLALLSRVAFGLAEYRVFYDDPQGASNWLTD